MYSRMAFYIGEGRWKWISAAPVEGSTDHVKLFRKLSEEVLRMFVFLSGSPTEVCFTPGQWEEHTQRFSNVLQEVVSEDDDSHGAIVFRHGLIAARIAMVLTALRKCEPMWNVQQCRCTDEDFHTAMAMTEVLLEHSLLLSSSLPGLALKARPLQQFHRALAVLRRLKHRFSYTDFVSSAMEDGASESTAKRLLRRVLQSHFVVNKEDGYVKNRKYYDKEGSKENPEP